MKNMFLPFVLFVFLIITGCAGDSSKDHDSIEGVPDENNPIIQAKKQKAEMMDSIAVEIENTEKEIKESAEKVDEAIDKL